MIMAMKKVINAALSGLKQAQYAHKNKTIPQKSLIENVPYFSQWESPKLVEGILSGKFDAKNDPNWKSSGAKTKDEYALWSANACGMTCTKMILAKEIGKAIPLVELANKSLPYGVYRLPLEDSVGLLYAPYINFLSKEFSLTAKLVRPLTVNQIVHELSQNNYVIASVSPKIRNANDTPPNKGGHLVLLLGYDLNKNELSFHNPSGFKPETQSYAAISFNDFKKFFGGRGLIVEVSK
jgi:hypothetical protein